jgi:polyvinyl alcohol dehydrogenase (cytochrome)
MTRPTRHLSVAMFAAGVLFFGFIAPADAQWASEPGFGVVQQQCMKCHGKPDMPQAPGVAALRENSAEKILEFLTTKLDARHSDMKLSDDDKKHVAEALSGRMLGSATVGDISKMPNRCAANPPMGDIASGPSWNGWGNGVSNNRYQPGDKAGITADQWPKLKLKWAFALPGGYTMNGQTAVVAGRVFVGSDAGWIYSLDAKTGCVYWSYMTKAAMRNAISVAPVKGRGTTKYAAYFGDLKSNAYALDAQTGKELWVTKVDDNYAGRITGAPAVYDGRVYVPLAKWESNSAKDLNYPCCTVRGSVTALDANTGKQIWKHFVIPEPPKPTHKNSIGTQQYGPSGGSVWNTPAVDPLRGMIYFGTGEATNEPAPPTTDALLAVDIKTGKLAWHYQGYAGDAFIIGCGGTGKTENCPENLGPDADIGASVILKTLPGGKRMVLAGMKDGTLFAVDPDQKGKLLWKTNVLPNPALSMAGITWGGAADDRAAYFGLTGGGVVAVQLTTGEKLWMNPIPPPPGRGRPGNSAAVSAIPGVVFSAARTGIMYALNTADGKTMWEFDTAKPFETVNKIPAKGGTIGSAGPVVTGGMLFVGSGYGFGGGDRNGNVLLAFSAE